MITIEITKYRVKARLINGQIIEDQRPEKITTYKEQEQERSSRPADLSDQKNKFIEKTAKSIAQHNERQKRLFKMDSSKPFLKLIITNIK